MNPLITHPFLLFALLVGTALLVPILCQRLRLPAIVGLVLAGVVYGPSGTGLIDRGELVTMLGQAGLLFIVFVAGLEIDLARFRKYRSHSLVFGTISYLVPQITGILAGLYLLGFSLSSAILLGSMFGSHTLLAYPVAARLGIVKSVPVTTAVGGTLITDTAALLVLAIIANSAAGGNGGAFWATFAFFLGAFVLIVFGLVPRLARWFYRTVPDEGARDFLFTLLLLFGCAWLAEFAGLQPIIGAFLCGIALNRLIPERSPLMSRIQFVGKTLLVPMFLLSVGMLVDPRAVIGDGPTLLIVVTMSATVLSSKWLAAFLAGRLLGYPLRDCWILYGMSVNQAAATLAAVIVGFEIGLFGAAVVNGAIVMILTSTLIGPLVTERWGRQLAANLEHGTNDLGDMPQRILIPVANPQTVEPLMDLALLLRERASVEPIYPLAIVTEGSDVDAQIASAEKLLARAAVRGHAGESTIYPITRVDVNIAEGIRRALVEQQITTVVIGWSGHASLAHRIFGGVLDQLLAQTRQTVIVARIFRSLSSAKRVVLAAPRSAEREPTFRESLRLVKVLCQQLSAPLHVIGPSVDAPRFRQLLDRSRPEVRFTAAPMARFRDLPEWVAAHLGEEDLLILLSARDHRLSWTAPLETLPRQLAARLPDRPFLILYPPEDSPEALPASTPPSPRTAIPASAAPAFVHPDRIAFLPADTPLEAALESLLGVEALGCGGNRRQLVQALARCAAEYPIEIAENTCLLHTHAPDLAEPLFALVRFDPPGLPLPGIEARARLLIALATPADFSPKRYLRLLAQLVEALRAADNLTHILHDPSPAAVAERLRPLNERVG